MIASMAGVNADGTPAEGEGDLGLAMAPVRKSHRRGLITLLSVAIVMVLGGLGAVVLLVTTDDEPIGGKLGTVHDIDTLRPEDPITHRPLGSGATAPQPNPLAPRTNPHPRIIAPSPPSSGSQEPEPPPGNSLSADEIEDVARKHQDITNRCYMRSQRGADAILIGDVKKISVTFTVDRDGNVSELKLSEHEADNLGKCLTVSIKGWKFRPSAGGTFRFSLNFVGS
jgi:outer membrane biosynthesis protein TonB